MELGEFFKLSSRGRLRFDLGFGMSGSGFRIKGVGYLPDQTGPAMSASSTLNPKPLASSSDNDYGICCQEILDWKSRDESPKP